ncbi:hypothetical protein BT69DRAFT_1345952 [Atractiella rhizophila]|nr:hypothetical protein BT69DRAFT_1345952 [Atractiella rhizophila]
MLFSLTTVFVASLATGALSKPVQSYKPASCNSFYFDVEATYERLNFNFTLPTTKVEMQALVGGIFAGTINPVSGSENITDTYRHFGKLCYPLSHVKSKHPNAIQVLVHAGWEVEAEYEVSYQPEKYSYIDYATSQGYTIFAYDRLGLGRSEKIDGRNIQLALNVEIVRQIITKLRSGTFGHGQRCKYDQVALMGHSAGSAIVNSVLAHSPELIDAAIMLGYGHNVNPDFITAADIDVPSLASPPLNYPASFVAISGIDAKLAAFYAKEGTYDPKVAKLTFDIPAPAGLGELITLLQGQVVAENYKGHAAILIGANDLAFCPNGFCDGDDSLAGEAAYFPAVASFKVKTFNNTGHGILNHYSSKEVQKAIIQYFDGVL